MSSSSPSPPQQNIILKFIGTIEPNHTLSPSLIYSSFPINCPKNTSPFQAFCWFDTPSLKPVIQHRIQGVATPALACAKTFEYVASDRKVPLLPFLLPPPVIQTLINSPRQIIWGDGEVSDEFLFVKFRFILPPHLICNVERTKKTINFLALPSRG